MVNMGTEGTRNVELGCKELFIFVRVTPDTDAMTHEYLSTESLTLVYWARFQAIAFYGLSSMLSEGLILTGVSAWIG